MFFTRFKNSYIPSENLSWTIRSVRRHRAEISCVNNDGGFESLDSTVLLLMPCKIRVSFCVNSGSVSVVSRTRFPSVSFSSTWKNSFAVTFTTIHIDKIKWILHHTTFQLCFYVCLSHRIIWHECVKQYKTTSWLLISIESSPLIFIYFF